MPIAELLRELSEADGVSGYETAAGRVAAAAFAPYADEVHTDAVGNVTALKRASRPGVTGGSILLAGHLDEIGLMVTAVDKGYLRITGVGGFDTRVLPGQEVLVHGQRPLPGIIGCRAPHVLPPEERQKVIPMDELFVDVGLPAEDVASLVAVGDLITVQRRGIALANRGFAGKAMDDRSAVAAIIETFRLLAYTQTAWSVYGVATVQEEASEFLGARTSAYRLQPDLAIALDVGHAEIPDSAEVPVLVLGKGPGIALGPNVHPKVYERLVATAKAHEIPWQVDPCPGATGTDAWALQVVRQGIPTGLLDIPLRYMHTSVETLCLTDLERIARLLAAFIAELDAEYLAELRGA